MKLILAAALSLLAAPVFAADPATMTCKDMMAMDAAGMTTAGVAMKSAMKSAMKDDAKVAAMSDTDVTKMVGVACGANPTGTVMDAMKTSMTTAMTCKEMMAMDAKGMAAAGIAMKSAMKADAKVAAMADADVTKSAGAACAAHPDGTVMDAMKM